MNKALKLALVAGTVLFTVPSYGMFSKVFNYGFWSKLNFKCFYEVRVPNFFVARKLAFIEIKKCAKSKNKKVLDLVHDLKKEECFCEKFKLDSYQGEQYGGFLEAKIEIGKPGNLSPVHKYIEVDVSFQTDNRSKKRDISTVMKKMETYFNDKEIDVSDFEKQNKSKF